MRLNKSTTYLLPILLQSINFDNIYYDRLVNTYIFDNNDKYKDCIFLHFSLDFESNDDLEFEDSIKNNSLFLDTIDIDDNNSIYIYKFPKDYLKEYNLFINGKYSEFGKDAIMIVLNFFREYYKREGGASMFIYSLGLVFKKSDMLRRELEEKLRVKLPINSEVSSIMNKEEETIKLD